MYYLVIFEFKMFVLKILIKFLKINIVEIMRF